MNKWRWAAYSQKLGMLSRGNEMAQLQSVGLKWLCRSVLQKCSTCNFTGLSHCMLAETPENVILSNIFHFLCLFVCNLLETPYQGVQLLRSQIWTCCLLCVWIRYNSQACGVLGGKHSKARPPLQSLQDEPPPQMWERSGAAALHGQTGKIQHIELYF